MPRIHLAAAEESQLQGTLQDLVTQARGHTDPRQLKIVVEAARGLALGASAGSQYALLKDKLLRYASAKQSFLAFYETAQPTVFVKHPLTNNLPLLITISAPPTGWGNGAPTRRAQFLAAAGPAKYAGTLWLETESPCDPRVPAYFAGPAAARNCARRVGAPLPHPVGGAEIVMRRGRLLVKGCLTKTVGWAVS